MNREIDMRIKRAQIERRAARDRLSQTLVVLKDRLDPRLLARQAMDEVREQGNVLADQAVNYARTKRPVILVGVAALAALIFRHDIGRLIAKMTHPKTREPGDLKESEYD